MKLVYLINSKNNTLATSAGMPYKYIICNRQSYNK